VHLRGIPFEETTTAAGEKSVPSEDHRGGAGKGFICHVIADGILGVAWGRKAPLPIVSAGWSKNQTASLELQRPDGERIGVLYNLSHGFDLLAASIDWRVGEFLCLYASGGR
jgi:hypothetical protein